MLPFNLILSEMIKNAKSKSFEPLEENPGNVKQITKKLDRCPKCMFLIFDNYWMDEIENRKMKVCTTCGWKI